MSVTPQMFQLSIMIGAALLALWVVVRFPKLVPSSLVRAVVHCVIAYVIGSAFLVSVPPFLRGLPLPNSALIAIVGGTLPAVVYLFTAIAWFIVNLQRLAAAYR